MDMVEQRTLLADFAAAYAPLEKALTGIDAALLAYVPREPADAWSINDHLVHLLDADMMLWYRARVSVAEPGSAIPVWQESTWRERLAYGSMDGPACLALAVVVRRTMARGFEAFVGGDWSGYAIVHPVRGTMGLADVLRLYRDHAGIHLAYVERNMRAFGERG